jgi:hypothetical protein
MKIYLFGFSATAAETTTPLGLIKRSEYFLQTGEHLLAVQAKEQSHLWGNIRAGGSRGGNESRKTVKESADGSLTRHASHW